MTISRVSHITVIVEDQEEALQWYRQKLGLRVCMDNTEVVDGLRWLTVCPEKNPDIQIVLLQARTEEEKARVGTNLAVVLRTDDCRAEMRRLAEAGVEILEEPVNVPWGVSGMIRDLYGNPYNIVGPPDQ